MTELDHEWSQLLDAATARANEAGRHDVAEYLRLRATNDAIRKVGCTWLFNTFVEIAVDLQGRRDRLEIERQEPHNFAHGSSTMVGSRLNLRLGVRCLSIEAGWARVPSNGIMRSGALAVSLISHFGIPKAGAELRLVHADTLPKWIADDKTVVDAEYLRRHFDILLS
jgi:hypothetical protein